ncbi:MAG: hypothetical protein K8823_519 [Cenarchaeum symbiont of Oopsacas minuta]|nr:hypothetical protein [Cenarchaeum symbiont of Oopsacas minuta]
MSTTLQAIIIVVAVAALSIVAIDSLDIWKQESLQQNDVTVMTKEHAVYATYEDKLRTISVTGTASASVDPDIFTVRLGVKTQDENAGKAFSSNSESMEKIISALMDTGIERDELSTSSIRIYPVYGDYDYERNTSPLVGFKAENIVLIETRKLDLASSIIDSASDAGANSIDGMSFTLSSELRTMTQNSLLQDAVKDAKKLANEALQPLGKSVSDVQTVNLSPISYGGHNVQYSMAKAESFSSTPIFSSSEDVTTNVYIVFLIQ